MKKMLQLKKANPTTQKTMERLTISEIETFFRDEEITDLQKYTFTFSLKKREK